MEIDSENATITYEDVNGNTALIINRDYGTSIIWSEGDKMISISTEEFKEQTLKIAKSVCRIK